MDPIQGEWGSQVTGLTNFAAAPPTVYGEVQYAIRTLIDESGVLDGVDPAVRLGFEAQTIGAIMTQLQEMESDPLININTPEEAVEEYDESFNIFAFVVPSFTVMFAFFQSGLVLYWSSGTAWLAGLLAFHLASVLTLFLLMPYSKMVHGFYRLAALCRDAQIQNSRAP